MSTQTEPSPLWCFNEEPHPEHWSSPRTSDRGNYCSGRPSTHPFTSHDSLQGIMRDETQK